MKNVLKEILNAVLIERGFKKKSTTWFVERPETIAVVNLQKSQWSEQYYVNLATWVKALGETDCPPKEHLCHVRIRLASFADDQLENALNLANTRLTDAERRLVIEKHLLQLALPFLDKCGTIEDLRRLYGGGKLRKAMVHKNLKQLLSV